MNQTAFDKHVESIIRSDHADPFGFLGMHTEGQGDQRSVQVRCFLPYAKRVAVVDTRRRKEVADLPRVHEEGMFAGHVPDYTDSFPYRLRVETEAHGTIDVEDPYRFPPVIGDLDIHLLAEGTHLHAYRQLGAHPRTVGRVKGVSFAVWAPNARRVSVVGDFNGWDGRVHPMRVRYECGVWEIFIPGLDVGTRYKYEIRAQSGELMALKSDPCAFYAEVPPSTASVVATLKGYKWGDRKWMASRARRNDRDQPICIYEVHLGSWRRNPDEGNRYLTYREMADELVTYVKDMGYTHLELMPISEYPFDGSWGYQPTGMFAPTSRYGTPDDFRYFIDACHQAEIGVLIDWVAGHFPGDAHGLGYFDGSHLYEHADPRQGRHMDWDTLIYNYGRTEVTNFLLSNALYWMEEFHIDGLRVDAVASMLYLDYSREEGQWIPNKYGGRENLEAIDFLKRMNELVYGHHDGVMTVAEESTSWPMVSRPTYLGGLGFGYKWNMGWMNDTLRYMNEDPVHRKYHHNMLTFGMLYAFHENFILPLSHDEVVHGKGSMLNKMPGDSWQQFANLRVYYAFMYTMPGKKLLFMGGEFGQGDEWSHDDSLAWHLLEYPLQRGLQNLVRDLNHLYRSLPALYEVDFHWEGFAWIDCHDADSSIVSFIRRAKDTDDLVVVVANFTPVVRESYLVGVPRGGFWKEILNTDSGYYEGSGVGNAGGVTADEHRMHDQPYSVTLKVPPLGAIVLQPEKIEKPQPDAGEDTAAAGDKGAEAEKKNETKKEDGENGGDAGKTEGLAG